jgi:hypothetical protein
MAENIPFFSQYLQFDALGQYFPIYYKGTPHRGTNFGVVYDKFGKDHVAVQTNEYELGTDSQPHLVYYIYETRDNPFKANYYTNSGQFVCEEDGYGAHGSLGYLTYFLTKPELPKTEHFGTGFGTSYTAFNQPTTTHGFKPLPPPSPGFGHSQLQTSQTPPPQDFGFGKAPQLPPPQKFDFGKTQPTPKTASEQGFGYTKSQKPVFDFGKTQQLDLTTPSTGHFFEKPNFFDRGGKFKSIKSKQKLKSKKNKKSKKYV